MLVNYRIPSTVTNLHTGKPNDLTLSLKFKLGLQQLGLRLLLTIVGLCVYHLCACKHSYVRLQWLYCSFAFLLQLYTENADTACEMSRPGLNTKTRIGTFK